MTRAQAIARANEMKGGALAKPYSFHGRGAFANVLEWGVTDYQNWVIPEPGTEAFRIYQLRFMEV